MLRATSRKIKGKRGKNKYVGIVSDAATLGVDRTHLFRVLRGDRNSGSLLRRYQALKGNRL